MQQTAITGSHVLQYPAALCYQVSDVIMRDVFMRDVVVRDVVVRDVAMERILYNM